MELWGLRLKDRPARRVRLSAAAPYAMDPRDPRQAGDDEEELTERYGPPAPEPQWTEEARKLQEENIKLQLKIENRQFYSRERFILRCVAWIIGVQFGFYIIATGVCGEITRVKLMILREKGTEPLAVPFCAGLPDKLQNSVDQGLAVLLALLGGSALMAADNTRSDRRRERMDPRQGGGDQP
jgi:hypothetical protein